MEFYGNAPNASMDMHDDPVLRRHLEHLIAEEPITVAIETGTHLGTGSTRILAECFDAVGRTNDRPPPTFHTIEANPVFAEQAKRNLGRLFPWVDVRWGLSVMQCEAIGWMSEDRALRDHARIHGVWIDNLANPMQSYIDEMAGLSDRPENLLPRLLVEHRNDTPLVVLDSAGGIGLLEFQTMRAVMKWRRYYVLLDDVKHIKHYRSFAIMKHSTEFDIIAVGEKWALACHPGWAKEAEDEAVQ